MLFLPVSTSTSHSIPGVIGLPSAVFGSRSMSNGAQTIGYQLYLDSGRATVWGNGTAGSSPVAGTGTGSNQSLTIYGRLPSLSGAVPGNYSDTVTITISY